MVWFRLLTMMTLLSSTLPYMPSVLMSRFAPVFTKTLAPFASCAVLCPTRSPRTQMLVQSGLTELEFCRRASLCDGSEIGSVGTHALYEETTGNHHPFELSIRFIWLSHQTCSGHQWNFLTQFCRWLPKNHMMSCRSRVSFVMSEIRHPVLRLVEYCLVSILELSIFIRSRLPKKLPRIETNWTTRSLKL